MLRGRLSPPPPGVDAVNKPIMVLFWAGGFVGIIILGCCIQRRCLCYVWQRALKPAQTAGPV